MKRMSTTILLALKPGFIQLYNFFVKQPYCISIQFHLSVLIRDLSAAFSQHFLYLTRFPVRFHQHIVAWLVEFLVQPTESEHDMNSTRSTRTVVY